jgi:hypothetical protein
MRNPGLRIIRDSRRWKRGAKELIILLFLGIEEG